MLYKLLLQFGHIVNGIQEDLIHFQSWRINVKRDANSTPHILVRKTTKHVIDKVWIKKISNCIYDAVLREQVVLFDFWGRCHK